MVKAILFDFWGTIVENGVWSPTKQVQNILQISLPFSEYVVRMEKAMMTSPFETLREAFQHVCTEFTIQPDERLLDELVGMWNKNWMLARPYPEAQETLQELRQQYKVYLVTNSDLFSVPNVVEKHGIASWFDNVFLSCHLQTIKTDKNFLKRVLSEINLPPEDCVFVGDSIQSDMAAAQRMEIRGILLDRSGTREFEPKIASLHQLGRVLTT